MERSRRIFLFCAFGVFLVALAFVSVSRAAPRMPSDHIRGPLNALVTVTVYGDSEDAASFALLHEALLLSQTFPLDLRLEYRHAPRPALPSVGSSAATVLECAGRFGVFWKTLDSAVSSDLPQSRSAPESVDAALWKSCLNDPSIQATIASDRADARVRGIRQAPALLLDGKRFDGSMRFDALRAAVTERLTAENTVHYVPMISAGDLWERVNEGRPLMIVDIRSKKDFTTLHLPAARSLPMTDSRIDSGTLNRVTAESAGQVLLVVDDGSDTQRAVLTALQRLGVSVMRFEGMEAAAKVPGLVVRSSS